MENRKKVLNLLGLATRAGKTASGEFMTEKAIKSGKAYLVIVSEEASDNTKKMFENSCAYYKVPRVSWYSGSCSVSSAFTYGAFTLSGRLSQNRSVSFKES